MKAAVLKQYGQAPVYDDFADPVIQNNGQILLTLKAAAVKNLDKGIASGRHYASGATLPVVTGTDGVGLLPNGTRVYANGITGMIAEKALIPKNKYAVVPDGLSDAAAAALPNAVFGAAMALYYRAGIKKGDTVLVNGATGVTGKTAVQLARHYGAAKIIATGRNEDLLKRLLALGADEVISLKQDDAAIINRLNEINSKTHIDIVIDYTWGHPAELILMALKGGGLHNVTAKVRFVTVGSMAGETIQLHSGILRSSAIEILGSGFGSVPQEAMDKLYSNLLPEMFALAVDGKLEIETITMPLKDIQTAWDMDVNAGKRLVVLM